MNNEKRTFFLLVFLVSFCGFLLRVYELTAQPPTGDDVAVAISAMNYMERGHLGPTMWNHPGLRNILVHLSRQIFGDGAWGLKSASLVLGTLSIPLLAATARRLFGNAAMAITAAFFLAIDPLHIDYSRQAINEVYMAFFALLGIWLTLLFMERGNPWLLFSAGAAFGLGISSKWYVVFPLAVTVGFLAFSTWRNPELGKGKKLEQLLYEFIALSLMPLAVYLLSFIPWFRRGFSIHEWWLLQKAMGLESVIHGGYNPYSLEIDHKAFLWFLKPVAYPDFIFSEGKSRVLLGISNPLTWLLTIPALVFTIYRSLRGKKTELLYVSGLFCLTYLPFLATSRPIWAHTAFSVLPFAFMMTAFFIHSVLEKLKQGRLIIISYLLLVTVVNIPLYLLAIGKGHEINWLKPVLEIYRPINER